MIFALDIEDTYGIGIRVINKILQSTTEAGLVSSDTTHDSDRERKISERCVFTIFALFISSKCLIAACLRNDLSTIIARMVVSRLSILLPNWSIWRRERTYFLEWPKGVDCLMLT